MAKQAAPAGRRITASTEKPKHLATRQGAGRTRQPTEFDELVPQWYEAGGYHRIEAQGDDTEAQLEDLKEMYKAVGRAVSYHDLGSDRLLEDDPEDPEFQGYALHVHVREKQARGPKVGSLKDPETGKRVSPDDETGRYAELAAMREAGEI